MAWILLMVAGLLEITWSISMKYSSGLTKPGWAALSIGASILSFLLLSQAMKTVPVGTAYAVWTGIGATGAIVLGIILFNESQSLPRMVCLGLVVIGMVGLKVTAGSG